MAQHQDARDAPTWSEEAGLPGRTQRNAEEGDPRIGRLVEGLAEEMQERIEGRQEEDVDRRGDEAMQYEEEDDDQGGDPEDVIMATMG
eukprot:3974871-Lingulodinium_polyedra.AAC.1